MNTYRVYFSTGEIFQQEAVDSKHLYNMAKLNVRFREMYDSGVGACVCCKVELQSDSLGVAPAHSTIVWSMVCDNYGLDFQPCLTQYVIDCFMHEGFYKPEYNIDFFDNY